MDGGDLFAPRDWSSPLRALLGWRVLPSHSDAPCHLLINVGGTLSTGLRYVGDCNANLARMVETMETVMMLVMFALMLKVGAPWEVPEVEGHQPKEDSLIGEIFLQPSC